MRAEEGAISEIDKDTYAYHFHEPLGVVGQIIPFNFPLLMAAWKIAPGAGRRQLHGRQAGQPDAVVDPEAMRGASATSSRPACINVVNGPGAEIGKALASSKRIAKVAFTGETVTGRLIMKYAAQNLIPSTTELGGKSPNIFFDGRHGRRRRVPRQGDRGPRPVRVQQGRGLHLPRRAR